MNAARDDGSTAFIRNPGVIHTELEDEVLALNPDTGSCYSFTGPSARLWQILENPTSAVVATQLLVAEYEIEEGACQGEVLDYFARLAAEDLVRTVPAA